MKRNNKGFTLVELLAVIVILGLLMAIAIPSVTKYITQSRKKTLMSTMDSYVTAVTNAVNDNEFGALSTQDIIYYIPVSDEENNSCVSLEKGGSDPFGNWLEAYVAVNYNSETYSYDYYFTFYDDAGYGLALTDIDNLKESGNLITNPSPVNKDNITTQTNGRATKSQVLTSESCDVNTSVPGGNVVNNQGGNNQGGGVPALREGYLSGTWKFKDTLTVPDKDLVENIEFSTNEGGKHITYTNIGVYSASHLGIPVEVSYNQYFSDGSLGIDSGTMYTIDSWYDESVQTIIFTREQQVSLEFWNWFTSNATKIS